MFFSTGFLFCAPTDNCQAVGPKCSNSLLNILINARGPVAYGRIRFSTNGVDDPGFGVVWRALVLKYARNLRGIKIALNLGDYPARFV